MDTLVILNPAAGGGTDPAAFSDRIRDVLDAELVVTSAPGEAADIAAAAAAAGRPRVVAAGGDGTIAEVASGLYRVGGNAELGLIPVGTGNDLARSLRLPLRADAAARVVAAGRTRPLDLARALPGSADVEGRIVTNAAVGGFAGRIGEAMGTRFRRGWGPLPYIVAALRQLPDLRPYTVRLEADGQEIEDRILMAIIANGRFAGGRIPFAPSALTDDGLLDIVLIRAGSPHRIAALVPRILTGRHPDHPGVRILRAAQVSVASDPAMWVNLDGETWHSGPCRFRVLPAALRVLVP